MRTLPAGERPQPLLRARSTATSAASRSTCDRRMPRRCSMRSLARSRRASSRAFGRRPRAASASTPARCAPRHPRLICASISGFGQSGPYVERAAHDINYQALAGLLRPPALPGPLDRRHRRRDAGGAARSSPRSSSARAPAPAASIDVSIHEAAMAWSMFPTTGDLANACYNIYETADGEWLALGALEPKFWAGFCERIGRPELTPLQHAEGDAGACAARGARRHAQPHARRVARALCRRRRLPDDDLQAGGGRGRSARRGARRDDRRRDRHARRPAARSPAPALGADTDDVLDERGIGAAERASGLRRQLRCRREISDRRSICRFATLQSERSEV